MQWNAYLADSFAWLFLIIPAALAAAKLGFPMIAWWILWLVAAILGWFISFGYFWAFPPDNGSAAILGTLLGWLAILPFFGIFSVVWFVPRWHGAATPKVVTILLASASFALPIGTCFRRIPEFEAEGIAERELRRMDFRNYEITDVRKTWDGWSILFKLADGTQYPVFLSRSGYCTGMGG